MYKFGTKYITEEFLKSKEYEHYMESYLTDDIDRFNLGPDLSDKGSFGWRHIHLAYIYVWKWLCTYQYRDLIMDLVFSDKVGIDFGGAWGPVGGNAKIVDIVPEFDLIDDIPDNSLDYIFTSHTLEHVSNLDKILIKLRNKLKKDGIMVAIVPCYRCVRWRRGNINTHLWTFSLEDDKFTRIDKKIEGAGFKIKKAEYCWESSIFVLSEK